MKIIMFGMLTLMVLMLSTTVLAVTEQVPFAYPESLTDSASWGVTIVPEQDIVLESIGLSSSGTYPTSCFVGCNPFDCSPEDIYGVETTNITGDVASFVGTFNDYIIGGSVDEIVLGAGKEYFIYCNAGGSPYDLNYVTPIPAERDSGVINWVAGYAGQRTDQFMLLVDEITYTGGCTPEWSCSGFGECLPINEGTKYCNDATDANVCGVNYTGDYSEFTETQTCTYGTGGSGSGASYYNTELEEPEPEVIEEEPSSQPLSIGDTGATIEKTEWEPTSNFGRAVKKLWSGITNVWSGIFG